MWHVPHLVLLWKHRQGPEMCKDTLLWLKNSHIIAGLIPEGNIWWCFEVAQYVSFEASILSLVRGIVCRKQMNIGVLSSHFWWWKWSMWSALVLDQHLHLTWSIVRWPVYVVDLKAVHHVRLDHISGSLPIRPMPLIIAHSHWNARRYHNEDHVLLLTSSLSVTVSPLWCPLSHPCQDTIKLPYSTSYKLSYNKQEQKWLFK